MTAIQALFDKLRLNTQSSSSAPTMIPPLKPITTYYIPTPTSYPQTTLQPASSPLPPHIPALPPSTLLISLTHPHPTSSKPTSYFLSCIPDPATYIHHAAHLIQQYLKPKALSSHTKEEGSVKQWRHQLIELKLVDEEGLAYTCDGKVHICLKWVERIRVEEENGHKKREDAVKEFKGVLFHELTHTIQYDSLSTSPTWLTESIADYLRLLAHLDPPHWRKPGVGRESKGYEEGYDSGARFLQWITGYEDETPSSSASGSESGKESGRDGGSVTSTSTGAPLPQATRYPTYDPSVDGFQPIDPKNRPVPKTRTGPFPDFVADLNARMEEREYEEGWWVEMTGKGVEELWEEYLGYYKA